MEWRCIKAETMQNNNKLLLSRVQLLQVYLVMDVVQSGHATLLSVAGMSCMLLVQLKQTYKASDTGWSKLSLFLHERLWP